MRLESKTAEFEHTISTGRLYLEREGADRRLSSASCDSRIMDGTSIITPLSCVELRLLCLICV